MAFRFVHAADIHLDSPLRSLALRDPDLAALIGNATRRAFVAIVDLCLEERVDALLLAGDLYDGEQTSMKTARFLADQVHRLHEAGVQTFIIRGNHDALSRITRELTFPDSVMLFAGRPEAMTLERARGEMPVTIHGLSFAQPQAPEGLLHRYKAPVEGAVNIALMHTSLDGSPGHDHYAPVTLTELQGAGFHYWALGHIHRRSVVSGDCAVVMPGMPQGRDINEAGAKSVSLVTIRDDRSIEIEERHTGIAQFERVTVDVAGIEDWREMLGAVGAALEATRGDVASEHLIARLRLTGTTPLAWRIRRDRDLLETEAASRAAQIGKSWIEVVELATQAPVAGAVNASADPIGELRRLIDGEVLARGAFDADAMGIAEELRGQLPAECRFLLGHDAAAFAEILRGLVREGVEDVLARLHAGPDAAG